MDEVWVPSEFNRETFSRSGVKREKLRVVPYSVDIQYFQPITERYSIPRLKKFSFLYVSFWDWRKGFDLLLEAYLQEFTDRDDVSLLIRTNDPDPKAPKSAQELRQILLSSIDPSVALTRKNLPHFEILTEPLSQDDLRRLYNTCDLYISTDRANGWGMPCMEVMAMGKPAATINWSGSTQFMNGTNSLLIEPTGRLISIDPRLAGARPLYAGHQWAEVSVSEVRRVMRFAFENPESLQHIASQGMRDVRAHYSLAVGATRIHRAAWLTKLRIEVRKMCRKIKEFTYGVRTSV
jgi:glycosyltransferase involved in cell wall biosynthesis